jgi:hypothetical protein
MLNQALLSVQRSADPKATGYDFGFVTDARFLQFQLRFRPHLTGRSTAE